jgi:hypothetical protein
VSLDLSIQDDIDPVQSSRRQRSRLLLPSDVDFVSFLDEAYLASFGGVGYFLTEEFFLSRGGGVRSFITTLVGRDLALEEAAVDGVFFFMSLLFLSTTFFAGAAFLAGAAFFTGLLTFAILFSFSTYSDYIKLLT